MNRAYKGFLALILAVTLALGIAPSALASSFSRQSYMIVATKYPNNAGTVTGEGLYRAGQTVTVTAEPSVDWGFFGGFDGWYENGERVTTDKSYSFTATGDRILQARFSFIHDIILMHGEGGTVSGGGSSYSENASLTVRAVPNDGYVFGGWYENGIKASDNANYTFVVMGSRTLEARFVQNQRITVNSARGGSAAGGGSFHSGERITVNAVPDSGYQFDGWYANGQRVSTSASYSFEVTAAITLEARFSTRSYQISVTSGTGGTVSGGGTFTQNQQVSVSATSSGSGYIFDGWYEGGARVSSSQNYSFTATANRNLEARFTAVESISILTTAQPWQGGTVTGGGSYKPGDTVTLRAIPNDYYLFDGWWESGQRVSTSNPLQFTATVSHTLEARFSYISATPTPIANVRITTHAYPNYTGANVTANWQTGTNYYPRGTNVTLRASDTFAYAGITYYFQGWYENGYRISSSNTCNITANNDRDITAQYDDEMGDDYVYFWTDSNPQYGGTTNLDRNGGVTYYKKGETVWIQATPSEGYEFIGWYIGNKTFFSSSASTFFAANSSMGITARFKWTGGGGTQ